MDDFFEHEKTFLLEYHNRVKDSSAKCDRMIRSHKSKNTARRTSAPMFVRRCLKELSPFPTQTPPMT